MPGLGTIINVAAVIAGGLPGLLFGKKFNVGNMLPSLIIAIIYSLIQFYI